MSSPATRTSVRRARRLRSGVLVALVGLALASFPAPVSSAGPALAFAGEVVEVDATMDLTRLAEMFSVDGTPLATAHPRVHDVVVRALADADVGDADRLRATLCTGPRGLHALVVADAAAACTGAPGDTPLPLRFALDCHGTVLVVVVGDGADVCWEWWACNSSMGGGTITLVVVGSGNAVCTSERVTCSGGALLSLHVIGSDNSVCTGGELKNCGGNAVITGALAGTGNAVCTGSGPSCSDSALVAVPLAGTGNVLCSGRGLRAAAPVLGLEGGAAV